MNQSKGNKIHTINFNDRKLKLNIIFTTYRIEVQWENRIIHKYLDIYYVSELYTSICENTQKSNQQSLC